MKSIAFKSARIVYDQNLFERITAEGLDFDGQNSSLTVPVLSAAALILSKCESASVKKRTRDAFDIFFVLTGQKGLACAETLKGLANRFPEVADQVDKLKKLLDEFPDKFNANVSLHAKTQIVTAASQTLALLR